MSSDNGIYLLKTKGQNGNFEYRVNYASAISNLTYNTNYIPGDYQSSMDLPEGQWNEDIVKDYFGTCIVHIDINKAYEEAFAIQNYWGYTEYGICLLDYSNKQFPK